MPKKNMTPEERAAFGAKMKAARAAKKVSPSAPQDIAEEVGIKELLAQINEMKETNALLKAAVLGKEQTTNTAHGLVGTFEKYITDPDHYPNPAERLSKEERLARFAFPINYRITFEVTSTSYETIDKRRQVEPQFKIELRGVKRDDDGNPTGDLYIVRKLVMHEDPAAAIAVARENNLPIDETNEKAFLDEMRYLRIRDWLFQFFYPPKPQDALKRKEEVIGNQVVEVLVGASESPISFKDKL